MKFKVVLGLILVAAVALVVAALAASSSSGPRGKIVFASNRADGARELYVVNEDGSGEHRLTFNDIVERQSAWSPDGTRIAFSGLKDGNWDIYTVDAGGGDLRRLTTDPQRDDYPRWTSDGRIVFGRGLFGCPCTEWIVKADGSDAQQIPLAGDILGADPSPRGNRIVYSSNVGSSYSLHVAQLDGKGDRQITTGAAFGDFEPRFAPNGKDIVFLRDHTGADNDVYTVRRDGTGLQQLTDTPGRAEFWATWSGDGTEVLFEADGRLRAISVANGTERAVSTVPRAPLTDDFGDGVRDASLWHQINDPGGTVEETGGRLVASISANAVPGGQFNQVDEHIGAQCRLTGDYDYQVDYALLVWPHLGGFRAQLSAFFGDASVGRASVAVPWAPSWNDETYQGFGTGGNGSFATTDTAGTFRLVRTDGFVTGYVRHGDGWRPVFSGSAPGDSLYGLGLWAAASDFGHKDGSVAFDNFKLSSGALSCPDWWTDASPDVWAPRAGDDGNDD